MGVNSTRVSRHVSAPREIVYRALLYGRRRDVDGANRHDQTADPSMRGEMTITITLTETDGGTDIVAVHDGLPPGFPAADNEVGWRLSLEKLAALVEAQKNWNPF